jgi:hypothetical protein
MEIKSVEDLTPELFSKLLNEKWIRNDESDAPRATPIQVGSVSLERVNLGVLSQVYRVHLQYKDTSKNSSSKFPPKDWLVKLCRPDLNLSWMSLNEAIFYERIAPQFLQVVTANSHNMSLPFSVPPFLSGDEYHVILQEIMNVERIPLMNGCPSGKIPILLQCLASLHAKFWISHDCPQTNVVHDLLVFPPGMGQRLHPLQKEGLFVSSWNETLEYIQFDAEKDADTIQFITVLCEQLENLKLRSLHSQVHQHRVTLVHGDFHVGNCLFPKIGSGTDESKLVLVDWAAAGFGNPMIDFAFFLVASTNDQVVSKSQQYLKCYHQLLLHHRPELAARVPLQPLQEWFALALLCQWTILVAYDGVCRHIAGSESDKEKRDAQFKHFRDVNRRAVLAMNSIDNWKEVLSMLEPATDQDKEEAQTFCNKTALEI